MQKFTRVTGIAAPLMKANIDTDVIIPAKRLVGHRRDELGAFAFEAHRYQPDRTDNPEFVLNRPRYRGAKILVAGENFGCGSSRESAVWALAGFGFRCVIAPSFGDIFHSNCFKNGVLPVRLAAGDVAALAAFAEGGAGLVTVDLEAQQVRAGERRYGFDVPPLRKEALRSGLDDLGLILRRRDEISRFEQADRVARPWAHLEGD